MVDNEQSLCLATHGVRDFGEVVLKFQKAACEGNEIVGEGTNLGIEEFVGFVVGVSKTRFEATNGCLQLFGDGSENKFCCPF